MQTSTEELLKRIIDRYKRFARVSENLNNHGDYLFWSQLVDIYEAKLTTLRFENANQSHG